MDCSSFTVTILRALTPVGTAIPSHKDIERTHPFNAVL